LDEYLPSQKTFSVEVAKARPELGKNVDKNDTSRPIPDSGGKSKSSKSRHNRDWKGLVMDDTQPPPLRSAITGHGQHEEKARRSALRARQSVSPDPALHRKRNRPDEQTQLKVSNYCACAFLFLFFCFLLLLPALQVFCNHVATSVK